ncbi:MAG: transcription termination/antitermination protein NusA [Alphaproteobacteria bacterium]|nr:transcription termination/antitermination protein NusA [Alphaproteobacteria bacterium]OJV13200.1 MAG: transcription termination/antitermination protein NusA [Alphaproteobacteria bacterium 33-17]
MNNFANIEIIQIAESVARDKMIPKETVLQAMESAIQVASRKKYGMEHNIKVNIDPKNGSINIFKLQEVVEEVENPATEISLKYAKLKNPDITVGEFIQEQLPPIDLGRVAAQSAKQVIINKIFDAEREKQYQEFAKKMGEIAHGTVKRVDAKAVIVDLGGRAEAALPTNQMIKGELFRQNDRIRAYISEVKRETKGQQIILSRTHNEFLVKLFEQEVPEIYNKTIEIKGVAREAGSRSKISVYTSEDSLDPVGSCVGVRGSRVQAIITELNGEKIDIIKWSGDPATYVINALAPAEVQKVIIDEDNRRIDVVVPNEQLSLAIGRKGQNVRLASQLTGWGIDVLTDEQESKRRIEEFNSVTKVLIEALDVDEMIAQLLASEGFSSVQDLIDVDIDDLTSIQGFDQSVAEELKNRAITFKQQEQVREAKEWRELGVSPELAKIEGFNNKILIALGKNDVKSLNDLADLSRDELLEYCPDISLDDDQIDELILELRKKIYK